MPVALVTGTSTGIGQSTALRLARDGHHVVATMRNPAAGAPLIDAREAEGFALDVVALDVTDPAACEEVIGATETDTGPIDILVNNAGIGGMTAVEDTTDAEWAEMFETNVIGPMRLIRLVLPSMRERRTGTIVNVTSVAGRVAFAPQGPYAASKFALEAASEALAQEVASLNIRVVIIEPGVILTPIFFKGDPEPPAGTHYADSYARLTRMFVSGLENPTMPEVVADTISDAISTDTPVLRYPVGDDAHQILVGRAAITDEAYVALGEAMSIDDFASTFKDAFGIEI
jgi:NAD(P)-dependent dehydrogenase (short-subunit alcohol dehydrogenase family)